MSMRGRARSAGAQITHRQKHEPQVPARPTQSVRTPQIARGRHAAVRVPQSHMAHQ